MLSEVIPDPYQRNLIREHYKEDAVNTVLSAINGASYPGDAIDRLANKSYQALFPEDRLPTNIVLLGDDDAGLDPQGNVLLYHDRRTGQFGNFFDNLPGGESRDAIEGYARLLESDR